MVEKSMRKEQKKRVRKGRENVSGEEKKGEKGRKRVRKKKKPRKRDQGITKREIRTRKNVCVCVERETELVE